jgi:hypothetical protein
MLFGLLPSLLCIAGTIVLSGIILSSAAALKSLGLSALYGKVLPGKGFKAQPDRAATNGGTLEARRAGTSTAA